MSELKVVKAERELKGFDSYVLSRKMRKGQACNLEEMARYHVMTENKQNGSNDLRLLLSEKESFDCRGEKKLD